MYSSVGILLQWMINLNENQTSTCSSDEATPRTKRNTGGGGGFLSPQISDFARL